MFTGIIQAVGRVQTLAGARLVIECPPAWPNDPIAAGESIAVNGCCLTALAENPLSTPVETPQNPLSAPVERGQGVRSGIPHLEFDLSPETLSRTALADLVPGTRVNLERAMRPQDRFGGHIVQGHVDATGAVRSVSLEHNATIVTLVAPDEGARYLIDKGSIAVDGVSLTVVRPRGPEFEVWVIPHTLAETRVGDWEPGDRVNLEYDVLAKYLERLRPLS